MTTDVLALSKGDKRDFKKLETVVAKGLQTFYEVGEALREIRDRRLYREEFSNFEQYCRERWSLSKTHVNRQIQAAQAARLLDKAGAEIAAVPESHIRPLTKLPADRQAEAWAESLKRAGGESNVTRTLVDDVVQELLHEGKAEVVQKGGEWTERDRIVTRFINHARLMQSLRAFCEGKNIEIPAEVWTFLRRFR